MQRKFLNLLGRIEWPLLLSGMACSAMGIWLIYMASSGEVRERYVLVQTAAAVMGVAGLIAVSFIDPERLFPDWRLVLVLELALIAILIPFGVGLEQTGNKSWIRFSVMGFSTGFQPGEIAKPLYIIALAGHAAGMDMSFRAKNVAAFALHGIIPPALLLIVSKDYGLTLSFAAIFIIMALFSGIKMRYFVLSGGAVALLFPYIWDNFLLDRQRDRLTVIIDTASDPLGTGFQTIQSVNAITAGGMLGSPVERLTSLPARHTDFIFAVAGEKLGFAGCAVIILFLVGFILRALYGFVSVDSVRGRLVCGGVAAALIFQTFANIGMCLGLSPVIGITLPFFSYGGTSAIVSYMLVGLLTAYKNRGYRRIE